MALSIARSPASTRSALDVDRTQGIARDIARDAVRSTARDIAHDVGSAAKESTRSRDVPSPSTERTPASTDTQAVTRARSLGRERATAERALTSTPAESTRAVRGIAPSALGSGLGDGPAAKVGDALATKASPASAVATVATPGLAASAVNDVPTNAVATLAPATGAVSAVSAVSETATTPVLSAEPTVDEAAAYLRETPQVETLDQMSHDQLRAYNVILQEVGSDETTLEHHESWHDDNGSGGQKGPGSGETFLGMHRSMLNEVERIVDPTGNWSAPAWDPTQPIPPELTAPGVERPADLAPNERPAWLTLDGEGSESGNARFGETIEIDGQTFDSLDDFETPDQLGRAFGEGRYHASAHTDIGGPMGSLRSPSDPIFYGWHGHIDAVFNEWLGTPNGQAWQAEHPDDPLLDGATPMSTYDSEESLEAARDGEKPEDHDHHG